MQTVALVVNWVCKGVFWIEGMKWELCKNKWKSVFLLRIQISDRPSYISQSSHCQCSAVQCLYFMVVKYNLRNTHEIYNTAQIPIPQFPHSCHSMHHIYNWCNVNNSKHLISLHLDDMDGGRRGVDHVGKCVVDTANDRASHSSLHWSILKKCLLVLHCVCCNYATIDYARIAR